MARASRGKVRWLREEYGFRIWRKRFIADVRQTISKLKVADVGQKAANNGFYDGCKKIDSEFDMETVIHTSVMENPTYLTLQRGKHTHSSIEHQYTYKEISIDCK